MTHIRAIETAYNGYRFRSRLEARWAVFFDTLGVPYEYEKEGYDLGGVRYLPDFWLPEHQCWVEIKGEDADEAHDKADLLATATNATVYVFVGGIVPPTDGDLPITACQHGGSEPCDGMPIFAWCECPFCRRVEIAYTGDAGWMSCECFARLAPGASIGWSSAVTGDVDHGLISYYGTRAKALRTTVDSPRLLAAYLAARQARFEHGESPIPPRG